MQAQKELISMTTCFYGPDEDVRKYFENLRQRKSERPLQVDEVDSCAPRTAERLGLTLEDDPQGKNTDSSVLR